MSTKSRPVRKASRPLPRTAKQMLAQIDAFFVRSAKAANYEGRKLWAVLSALRGPDCGPSDVKAFTTVHIRKMAFPKTAEFANDNFIQIPAVFSTGLAFTPDEANKVSNHFASHIQDAAEALGLPHLPGDPHA